MEAAKLPDNELQRLVALYATGLLDSPSEVRFDRITRLVQHYFGCEVALVSLIDSHRQWFKSKQGLDACETGRDISFCGHAILDDTIFHIADAQQDKRFADNPLVTGQPLIRLYAGAPLHDPTGYRIGTLCILDSKPRQLSEQALADLRDFADIVEREIAQMLYDLNVIQLRDAQSHLAESEQKFKTIIDVSRIATWEWHVRSGDVSLNARWADIVGYRLDELAETDINTWLDLLHPEDVSVFQTALQRHFSGENPFFDIESRLKHKDGHWVWVRDRGQVTNWDALGQPLVMYGTHEDITEHKHAQLEQQKQIQFSATETHILSAKELFSTQPMQSWKFLTEQMSLALDVARVSIWLLQPDGDTLLMSDLYERATAQHSAGLEIKKTDYPDYFSALLQDGVIAATDARTHPATRSLSQHYFEPYGICSTLDGVIVAEQGIVGVVCVEHVDSLRSWSLVEQNFMVAMVSIASTVNSFLLRHQLQQQHLHTFELLERTSELADIGTWEVTIPEMTCYWSEKTHQIHQVPANYVCRAEEGILFYKEGRHRERVQQLFQGAIEQHQPFDGEFEIITAQGEPRWVRSIGIPDVKDGVCHRVYGLFQDITNQKQAEIAQTKLSSLLQTVMHAASEIGIIATDVAGVIQVFNRGAELMLGYSAAELIGVQTPAIFHQPSEVQQRAVELSEQLGQVISGFRTFVAIAEQAGAESRRWTYVRKDGSELRVQLVVTAMRDEQHNITGYLGVSRDISQEEKALFELQQFFDLSQNLLSIASINGYFERVNRAFYQLLGYSSQELLTVPFIDFVHPDDVAATLAEVQKLGQGDPTVSFYNRYRHKQGYYVTLQWFATPDTDNGKLYCSAQDVTHQLLAEQALKSSEARLRALFELSPVGIALNDFESGQFLDVNEALVTPTGYTHQELLALSYVDLTPQQYEQDELKQVELLKLTGRYGPFEKEYQRKDGSRYPVLLSGILIADEEKQLIWSIVEDISERKQLEQMKNEFVSTVSHELRTPLTSISGALGLALSKKMGDMPQALEKMVQIAHSNSKRLTALINDLLDIEKLAAGKMQLNMQVQALAPIIHQAVADNQPLGQPRQIKLVLTVAIDPEVQVMVDSQRVLQVMANLLSNAIKFSPDAATVAIHIASVSGGVRVSVSDQGDGIQENFHARIFQRFSQANSADSRSKGGTGLGLALSKELVNVMQGDLSYESVFGQGACFYFELPLAQHVLT